MNKKNALLSVFNKNGIARFAESLVKNGFDILASEGTGNALAELNIPFSSAERASCNPPRLQGCIKTISYNIEAGILYDRDNLEHQEDFKSLNIFSIDLVVCNFPPIAQVVKTHSDFSILNVDVGGPLMVRSAGVNYKDVLVVVDQNDYELVAKKIERGHISLSFRKEMAIKAFSYCRSYDQTIIDYLQD